MLYLIDIPIDGCEKITPNEACKIMFTEGFVDECPVEHIERDILRPIYVSAISRPYIADAFNAIFNLAKHQQVQVNKIPTKMVAGDQALYLKVNDYNQENDYILELYELNKIGFEFYHIKIIK